MIKPIVREEYTTFWKKYDGSALQSWAWGDVKSAEWTVERLGIYVKDELVGVVSVFLKQVPFSSVTKLLGFTNAAYIPRGFPVKGTRFLKKGIQDLEKYYKDKGVAFILIDPDNNVFMDPWQGDFEKALQSSGWKEVGESEEPNQTNMVYIEGTDEELLAAMKPKWRRNIKKARREGVVIQEVTGKEGVKQFHDMLRAVEKTTSFRARSLEYFETIWDEMEPDGLVRVFTATVDDEVVAAYMVVLGERIAYEIYGGSTKRGRDTEASYLLKWEIMRTMRIGGRVYYDHWGVAPKDDENHPLTGISYFKSGFGGKYITFLPQYVKVLNPFGYTLYRLRKTL